MKKLVKNKTPVKANRIPSLADNKVFETNLQPATTSIFQGFVAAIAENHSI